MSEEPVRLKKKAPPYAITGAATTDPVGPSVRRVELALPGLVILTVTHLRRVVAAAEELAAAEWLAEQPVALVPHLPQGYSSGRD